MSAVVAGARFSAWDLPIQELTMQPSHLCQKHFFVDGPGVQAGQQVGQADARQAQHFVKEVGHIRTCGFAARCGSHRCRQAWLRSQAQR